MNETKSEMGWAGFILFFVVIWILFGAMAGPMGMRGGNNDAGWQAEKQGIIDSAKTQYLIETSSRQTQEYLATKIDFYEYQNLRDALANERNKNMVLENRIYSDAQFNALSRQVEGMNVQTDRRLDSIECQMLKRPNLFGIASTCSGQIIPPITSTT